jgi:DegV family protein with EDD domain
MVKVEVLSDSCASIPESFLQELSIQTVAYYIHRGGEVLKDLIDIQRADFLKWLETTKVLPKTACPGPGDYYDAYKKKISTGSKNIISIHMTSKGSGAYQAAKIAQSMVCEKYHDVRVEVVDTQNVSLCQGWMVIEAARDAIKGKSLDEILIRIKKMIPITQMVQTADSLKYLAMGGRIGKAQHLVGSLLNIKPIIGMRDGVIVPLGRARSRNQAYEMMVDYVFERAGIRKKIKIAYVHAGAQLEIMQLKNMVEERLTCVESFIAELSPALSVHTGPGTVGFCFYPLETQ